MASLLLTLNRFHTFFWCFHCWLWTSKWRPSLILRWYRAKIVNVNEKEYEVFYVDHGDREWVSKKNVANSWNDILTVDLIKALAQQAFTCRRIFWLCLTILWRRSGVFIVSFEHISYLVLVFLLLTSNM